MEAHIGDKNLVITTAQKTFHIDLAENVGINLKY